MDNTRLYNVITKKGYNIQEIENELTDTSGSKTIPARSCVIEKRLNMSKRVAGFRLTDTEATLLKNDKRIEDVSLHIRERDDVVVQPASKQTGNFDMNNVAESDYPHWRNWGHAYALADDYIYASDGTTGDGNNKTIEYNNQGEGVDIVIMDSGIQSAHPEFEDRYGNCRIVKKDWWGLYKELNPNEDEWPERYKHKFHELANTPEFYYKDITNFHGTACASLAAGTLYGVAKKANIYIAKIDIGVPYFQIEIDDFFNLILHWHKSKNGSRPTVLSNSWGTARQKKHDFDDINGGSFTDGTQDAFAWSRNSRTNEQIAEAYNIKKHTTNPFTDSSYQVLIEELQDAGVHVVTASGNGSNRTVKPDHPEYNNFYTYEYFSEAFGGSTKSGSVFHNRPNSPYPSERGILVGAVDKTTTLDDGNNKNNVAFFSNRGSAIDIYAAGMHLPCAGNSDAYYSSNFSGWTYAYPNRPSGSNFISNAFSGTSAACPVVAGVMACYLSVNPKLTPAQLKEKIINNAREDVLFEDTSGYYSDNGFLDSNNRIVYNKYNQNDVLTFSGLEQARGIFTDQRKLVCTVPISGNIYTPYRGTRTKIDGVELENSDARELYEDAKLVSFFITPLSNSHFVSLEFDGSKVKNGNWSMLFVREQTNAGDRVRTYQLFRKDAKYDDVQKRFTWTINVKWLPKRTAGNVDEFIIGFL